MLTHVQNLSQDFDPPATSIRLQTAKIRRRWSPEERRLRAIRARIFQRLLFQR